MIKPSVLAPRPSFMLTILGGGVATMLGSALIYLAPVFGFPLIDFPLLVGGLFSRNPDVALWLGYWLFFIGGVFVTPVLLALAWPHLPGYPVGYIGAAIKGVLWGLIFWVGSGLVLPLLGALNRLPDLVNPGFFAIGLGLPGAAGLLLGHLVYGLAMALIAAMAQGIDPIDTLGWPGYLEANVRDSALPKNGRPKQRGIKT